MSTEKFSLVQARHKLISLYKFLHQDDLNQDDLSNFSIGVYNLSETELNIEIVRYVQLIYHDFEKYIIDNAEIGHDKLKEETDIDKVCENLQRLFKY